MRSEHHKKVKQKVLSIFLGLSLLFNILLSPMAVVLADDLAPVTISLVNPDGTEIDNFKIFKGTDLEGIPENINVAIPEGYIAFEGWQREGADVTFPIQNVQTDLTLVAKFSNDYTISFAQDVAGQRTVLHTEKVTVGEVIPEPPVTVQNNLELPNGEHFTYWYAEGDDRAFAFGSTPATSHLTLLAKLSSTYTVLFISEGTQVAPQLPNAGAFATRPATPSRDGYTFSYWSANPMATVATRDTDEFDFSTPITSDTLLYAVWQAENVAYTVVYWVEKPNGSWGIDDPGTDPTHYDYYGSVPISNTDPQMLFTAGSSVTGFTQAQLNSLNTLLEYPYYLGSQVKTDMNGLVTTSTHYPYVYNTPDKVRVVSDPLKGDGSSIVNVYLQRKIYTFSFDLGGDRNSVNGRDYISNPISPLLSTATFTADKSGGGTTYSYQGKLGQIMPDAWPQHAQVNSGNLSWRIYGWFIGNYARTPHNATAEVLPWMAEAAEFGQNLTVNIAPEWTNDPRIIPINRLYYVEATAEEEAAVDRNPIWTFAPGTYSAEAAGEAFDGTARPYLAYNGKLYKLYEAQSGMQDSHGSAQRVLMPGTAPVYGYGVNGIAQTKLVSGTDGTTVKYVTNADTITGAHVVSSANDIAENCYFLYDRTPYTLSFDLQHASNVGTPQSITDVTGIKSGTSLAVSKPTDPQWLDHIFLGWYLDADCSEGREFDFATSTMPNSNLAVFAKWLKVDHRVKFMDGADTLVNQPISDGQSIDYKDADAKIAEIGGKGDFVGWYWYVGSSFTPFVNHPIYSNEPTTVILYAKWKTTDLTVTYGVGLGGGTVPVDAIKYKVNTDAIVLPVGAGLIPPAEEFFYAWKVQGDASGKLYYPGMTVKVDRSITLVAQYAQQSILKLVQYHHNLSGATRLADTTSDQSYTFYVWPGTVFTLQSALFGHDAYTQIGWTIDKAPYGQKELETLAFGDLYPAADNQETLHLYAVWQANPEQFYRINYELDGGENSAENPDQYTYGVGISNFEPATKTGHVFLGWFDAASGGDEITDISTTATGDKTLYAQFKQDQARIEAKPIERTIDKNTTYTWYHPEHEPVLYDEDNAIVPEAELWAIIDGVVYSATDAVELPEGVHDVTFTNVNPNLRFNLFSRLVTSATVKEVTVQTTATIIAKETPVKIPAPITVRYVDQSGKALKIETVYTGKIGDAISSVAPMIAGYELLSLSDKITAMITDQAQTFSFVYKPTNPGQPVQQLPTTGQTLPTTGQQLPRTGDSQNVFHLILGFLLVALVSFLSWVKLGKKFGKEMK